MVPFPSSLSFIKETSPSSIYNTTPVSDDLLERTFTCINDFFRMNYVMLRSYSEDILNTSETPLRIRGERYPIKMFTISFLMDHKIPYKPGLMFTRPENPPSYGWFLPEWADIILSSVSSSRATADLSPTSISHLDKLIKIMRDKDVWQKELIDMTRRYGLLHGAEYLQVKLNRYSF